MKLKEYMALCEPGTEITCWDRDIDSEFYFYAPDEVKNLMHKSDFPNVERCMERLAEVLDVVNVRDRGITVDLYGKLDNPAVIQHAKEHFFEECQYDDDHDVVMMLFDDNVTNISQGFENFSGMMVTLLDTVYGPEKTAEKQSSLDDKLRAAESRSVVTVKSETLTVEEVIGNVVDELQRARDRIKELGEFDDVAITADEELVSDIDKSIERLSSLSGPELKSEIER